MTTSQHSFLQLPHCQIAYQWINNDGKSPVLVFLHEGLGSIRQWKDYPETLCKALGLSGLVYDRQGYGFSDPLTEKRDETYLHQYALNELPLVVRELIGSREMILYGHSDGGSIALIYASNCPQGIKAIVTEAAHVFVEDITLEGILPVVEAFEEGSLKQSLEKYHGKKTNETFYAWSDTWHLKRFRQWNIADGLSHIQSPVLAIQGVDDEYGTEAQLDLIVENCSGHVEKCFLNDCGHAPYKQQNTLVLKTVQQFLSNIL